MSDTATPPPGHVGDPDTGDRGQGDGTQLTLAPRTNGDVFWNRFDSEAYFEVNYGKLRKDDRQIMRVVRDFFAGADIPPGARGVDVGTGTNLYPAMAMLPFCAEVDLYEYSRSNVTWLEHEVQYPRASWAKFWATYAEREPYAQVHDFRSELKKATVKQANVFELPSRRWDVGTMFFVACSLSGEQDEFRSAVSHFLGALKPNAPFAAAFMAGSEGYPVGNGEFPAVPIDEADVRDCLASVAYNERIKWIPKRDPFRTGYNGMIVATGRVAAE